MNKNKTTIGVALSLVSSAIFGGIYYAVTLMRPMNGEEIFGSRVLATLPLLTLFLIFTGRFKMAAAIFARLKKEPLLPFALLFSASLMGFQFWLFVWAPVNDYSLEVSLGYFLLPLTLVATGRLVYKNRLSVLQKIAVFCAALGVLNEILMVSRFAWPTFAVALGWPVYFMLRRRFGLNNLGGLWVDLALVSIAASFFLFHDSSFIQKLEDFPHLWWAILLLAVLSAVSQTAYIAASDLLDMTLFGLLCYVEPVFLVLAAFVIGATISSAQLPTYIAIWGAVGLMAVEGSLKLWERRKQEKP